MTHEFMQINNYCQFWKRGGGWSLLEQGHSEKQTWRMNLCKSIIIVSFGKEGRGVEFIRAGAFREANMAHEFMQINNYCQF